MCGRGCNTDDLSSSLSESTCMKSLICTIAAALLLVMPAWASGDSHAHNHEAAQATSHSHAAKTAPQLDSHVLEDIERHRGMARAHEMAAQCLEQGNNYSVCQKQLQTQCKGLALGKNCGMRHSH